MESATKATLMGNLIRAKFIIRLMLITKRNILPWKSYKSHTSVIRASLYVYVCVCVCIISIYRFILQASLHISPLYKQEWRLFINSYISVTYLNRSTISINKINFLSGSQDIREIRTNRYKKLKKIKFFNCFL